MNDEELKKEIERALAVEPSPQFAARVLQHIASQPRRFWIQRSALAGGIAAAAVVAAIIVLQPRENTTPKAAGVAPASLPPVENRLPEAQGLQSSSGIMPPPVLKSRRRAGPEVLVDPREVAALHSFLEDVQQQKIDPGRLKALFEAAEKAHAVEEIAPMPIAGIEPIRIPPLNSSSTEGGSL
jgi:hypothetical protein